MSKRRTASIKEVRDFLCDYFSHKANFREQMAERADERGQPWDIGKNEAYALSLRRMAEYVGSLSKSDPNLVALATCPALYDEDAELFEIPSSLDGETSLADSGAVHCGPRGNALEWDQCATWFTEWVATVIQEAPGMRAEHDRQAMELAGLGDEADDD